MATIINDIFNGYKTFNQEDLLKVVDFLPPHTQVCSIKIVPRYFHRKWLSRNDISYEE